MRINDRGAVRIEHLREDDRPALVEMLEDAGDLGHGVISQYRRRRGLPDVMTVAWLNGSLVGMCNASYNVDFNGAREFELVPLPPLPHALLERIYIRPTLRRRGVGGALVDAFLDGARAGTCNFAGAYMDQNSDMTVRTEFFRKVGFEVYGRAPMVAVGRRI